MSRLSGAGRVSGSGCMTKKFVRFEPSILFRLCLQPVWEARAPMLGLQAIRPL